MYFIKREKELMPMKNHKSFIFLMLLAILISIESGCKKAKIERFPKQITGIWFSNSGGGLLSSSFIYDVYLDNGLWYGMTDCNLCTDQKEGCNLCSDPCPGGQISEKKPYKIEGNKLIR
jgi:hypothetical protein